MTTICDLCSRNLATHIIDIRDPDGRPRQVRYCDACHEAVAHARATAPTEGPKPRVKLKQIMIVVATFAVINAAVLGPFRFGGIAGTKDQVRAWTMHTWLVANAIAAFVTLWCVAVSYIQNVMWFRRTGGVIPNPRKVPMWLPPDRESFVDNVVAIAILLASFGLSEWITPIVSPVRRQRMLVFFACMIVFAVLVNLIRFGPKVFWVWIVVCVGWIRREWRNASPPERICKIAAVAWLLAGTLWFSFTDGRLVSRIGIPMFGTCVAAWLGVGLLLSAGQAYATRRR